MTDQSSEYQDVVSPTAPAELQIVIYRLGRLAARASSHEAPKALRASTLEAITTFNPGATPLVAVRPTPAQRNGAGSSSWRPAARPARQSTKSSGFPAHLPAIFGGVGLLAVVAIVVATLFGSGTLSTDRVSADAVFRHAAVTSLASNKAAILHYRVVVTGGSLRVPQTGNADVRVRAAHGAVPQTVREDLSLLPTRPGRWCVDLHYAMVGRWGYEAPYANCSASGPMVLFGAFMQPVQISFPTVNLPANVFYGVSAARKLLHSNHSHVSVHLGKFRRHRVYIVTVPHWPGQPGLGATLYFDSQTYVLRGLLATETYREPHLSTYHYAFALTSLRILPSHSLGRTAFRLPVRYEPKPLPIATPTGVSRSKLNRLCPGIRNLNRLLHRGLGPLGACRTAIPHMTARRLANRIIGVRVPTGLMRAAAAGVFPRWLVKQSLRDERAYMTQWVRWSASLRWNDSTSG